MKLGVGRYSNMLARFLTGTATLDVVPELSAEISPVFILESERPEWEFLKGGKSPNCSISVSSSAVANGTCRLRNPSGSNVLAVIEAGDVTIATAAQQLVIRIGTAAADLATPATQASRDTRFGTGLGAGALKASFDAVAASGTVLYETPMAAATRVLLPIFPIVMAPGSSLDLSITLAVIATITVNLRWRERELTRYEGA